MDEITGIKNIRVIVRPWVPRKIPFQIPVASVMQILDKVRPKLKRILYAGWVKRKVNGKQILCYLAATADTLNEAKKKFKSGENFGDEVWNLGE